MQSIPSTALQLASAAELRDRPGRKWHDYADDVLPAWIAEMDFGVADPIRQALERLADEASYGYELSSLYPSLARAFADYMQQRFDWQVGTDHVLPVADLVQALFTAVVAFTEPAQGVVLQTPIYPPFQNAVRETGRRIVENPLLTDAERYVVDTDRLSTVFDGNAPLMLLCNPHNPTGRVLERPELEAIAAVAVERRLVVVADEVHADLVYPGRRHIPFASLSAEVAARTVTITSATKAYNIPGLRCGVMHFGSAALREQFRKAVPDRMLGIVNQFGIEATIVAWRDCASWISQALGILEQNRSRLIDWVANDVRGVRWYPPEATYLAWLDCDTAVAPDVSPQQYFLDRARVALSDGGPFGRAGQRHVRLNFGTSSEILEQVLARLAGALA
jgi:cystathionine beta-lyase